MKISIVNAFGLDVLYQELKDRPMPIKTAYKIQKLIKSIETDLNFYRESLAKILKEYAEVDENGQFVISDDGQSVRIKPDCTEECSEKINELQNIEIETSFDQKFTIDELEFLNLTMQQLDAFMPFIED